ncbi:MAG: 4Fe-4S dicluster domain-containing protein [Candidatus Omnitrophica bacterium]|nr:4Fe-4S dicluster domain-containing protein [Candidatus Omnitrophota bacterium]
MKPIDVLIIGAGPAGLATAIRLKQKFNKAKSTASVVVIEKAAKPGYHNLSGAVIETACLDELLPGWRAADPAFAAELMPVKRDEMYFLTAKAAFQIPELLVPGGMHHKNDSLISVSRLVDWLAKAARKEGVEIQSGFSAASLIWDKDAVKGVRLVDCGLDARRQPKPNFLKGEDVLAKVTVLADGPRGVLSREYVARVKGNINPQVYSIGIKQVFKVPVGHDFGTNRVLHTLGFPNRPDVFGGSFFYSMGTEYIAAGLILGLDWKYTDLNPQQEFELLKTHPLIARFLKDAVPVAAGARTIPEGGFYSIPKLWTEGALLVGDAAGLVNMEKIKGIHYAIFSGMAAADAIVDGSISATALGAYKDNLEARGVLKDMRHARNFRQVFQWGVFMGAPLSQIQSLIPVRLGLHQDHSQTLKGAALKRDIKPAIDRATFAALSGTTHREDEPSHLIINDTSVCQRCRQELSSPCAVFCPTEVYRWKEDGVNISASNCVHCGTCAIKCPFQNITWTPPEGGQGPRYKNM